MRKLLLGLAGANPKEVTIKIFAIIMIALVSLWLSYCVAGIICMFEWPAKDPAWYLSNMVWSSSFADLIDTFTGRVHVLTPVHWQQPWLVVYQVVLTGLIPFILSAVAARAILKAQGRGLKVWYSSAVIAFFVLLWGTTIILHRRSEADEMEVELNRVLSFVVGWHQWPGYYEAEFDEKHRPLDAERYAQLRNQAPKYSAEARVSMVNMGGGFITVDPPMYMRYHDPETYARQILKDIRFYSNKEITWCTISLGHLDGGLFTLSYDKKDGITINRD